MTSHSQIREDILGAVQEQIDTEPGKYGAVNFDQIKSIVDNVDSFIQQAVPVVATFSPVQYRVWLTSIAAVLHAATAEVDKYGGHS